MVGVPLDWRSTPKGHPRQSFTAPWSLTLFWQVVHIMELNELPVRAGYKHFVHLLPRLVEVLQIGKPIILRLLHGLTSLVTQTLQIRINPGLQRQEIILPVG